MQPVEEVSVSGEVGEPPAGGLTVKRVVSLTCEVAVVVGACRVLLVRTERWAGRGAGAEAGVAQRGAHLAGLTAVVHRPLDVQG